MYDWRKMSESERKESLRERRARNFPRHAPPHFEYSGEHTFIITAACFEHRHVIGKSPERMAESERAILTIVGSLGAIIYA